MTADVRTPQHLGREGEMAMQTVTDAVRLARSIEHDAATGAITKADASPVTVADFAVQGFVAARLARDFPDDALVAEEDATALREAAPAAGLHARVVELVRRVEPGIPPGGLLTWIDRGRGVPGRRFWALDPIDGTKGLLRGGQYAIALALIVDGAVQVGVLGCPRLSLADGSGIAPPGDRHRVGGTAVAVRGRGAWWATQAEGPLARLSVSAVADPARARVLHSFEPLHSDVTQLDSVLRTLGSNLRPVLMDSQAKHAVLASGEADVLLRFPTSEGFHDTIWDQAAGSLLIEEAGGRVTDLAGRALDFSTGRRLLHNDGLLASNGHLHDVALNALARVEGRSTRRAPQG